MATRRIPTRGRVALLGGRPASRGIDPGYSAPGRGRGRGRATAAAPAPATASSVTPARRTAKGSGLGAQTLAGPGGRQLQARVSSGAITGDQAGRTMRQRQTLAKAFGPDWREKLQVGGESFARVNQGLKANPGNPRLAAIRKKLLANRETALEAARKKNKGVRAE